MSAMFDLLRPDLILMLGIFSLSVALFVNTLRSWIKERQFKKKWMINNE